MQDAAKSDEPEAPIGYHPSTLHVLQFFSFAHLPNPELQQLSRRFAVEAFDLAAAIPCGPEKTAALRNLLEAKDCAVRAHLALTGDALAARVEELASAVVQSLGEA